VFFFFSKILDVVFSPLTWAIVLAGAAAFGKTERFARLFAGLAVVVLCVFSVEPVSNRLVRSMEEDAVKTARDGTTYDVVVLLGGLVDHRATATTNDTAYNDGVERLLKTFDLLRTGHARFAILSGGKDEDDDPIVEGPLLARQLAEWGIARERLITEDASRNTRENASFSARIIKDRGFRDVLLVTSAGHVPRALAAFRVEGVRADALPVDYRSFDPARSHERWLPRASALSASAGALRELAGRAIYGVLGLGR
jgi:uncharacterized SAM-binding protein YcdF (DUF218 family)